MQLKSRTLVATPAYRGDVVMQYAHSIVRDSVLAIIDGHFVEAPHFINDTYIHNARNAALKTFAAGEWDFLVFIDADMGWQAGALGDLISLPVEMDIAGGVYRRKEDEPSYPFNALVDSPIAFPVCEISAVATGFMRITRACAERVLAKYPSGRVFDHIVEEGGFEWGDDIAFCRRARAAGCKVFGKFDIEFDHVGPKAWRGRAQDHLQHMVGLCAEQSTDLTEKAA